MTPEVLVAFVAGMAAMIEDLARRQISNWISLAALVGGVGCQVFRKGWMGFPLSLAGIAAGFSVFLIFYLLGGMGGGDVKLMAGFGALLGWGRILEAALWAAALGGVIALGVLGFRAAKKRLGAKASGEDSEYIPYAPAIVLGVWLAMVPR